MEFISSTDFSIFLKIFVGLIAILNPFAIIPYYMTLHPKATDKEVASDSIKITISVFSILVGASLIGNFLLKFFNLDIIYLQIAGGVIITMMSISMVHGNMPKIKFDEDSETIKNDYINRGLIIPLAMPLLSGPGSISYIISHSSFEILRLIIVASFISSILVYFVIRYGVRIKKYIGSIGIKLVTRFMGIILLSLGIQIVVTNIIKAIKVSFNL